VSRVLLTGATGFIGQPLLRGLLAAGEEVHAITTRPAETLAPDGVRWHLGDLLQPHSASQLLDEIRPEQLVHLAWYVEHGRFWSARENVEWVEASLRLMRAFASSGGRRALLVGSCAEYEWGTEEDLDELSSRLGPRTLYGVCKDALRRIAATHASELGLELAWARLFFLYGPGEQPGRLVPSVVRALLAGERIATTAGEQVRDFLYVADAAAALQSVLASRLTGPVNVASGEGHRVGELLEHLGSLTGAGELIDRGARPEAASEPERLVAAVRRLREEAAFRPAFSLQEGLAETVRWWREAGISAAARP
jgi:nucleoside-diphosphate-sugar epimerase